MRRWPRLQRSIARRLAAESGYTLIELVIVISLSTIVVGVPSAFVIVSLNQQNVSASRSAAAAQEEVGVARLTRDLRSVAPSTTASFAWSSTSASVSMTIPVPGGAGIGVLNPPTETVAWSCSFPAGSSGSCTRSVNGAAAVNEIAAVTGASFSPVDSSGNTLGGVTSPHAASNPAYVGITVKVLIASQLGSSGTHAVSGITNPIILQDGVDLRNNSL